jgi:hypothetical protein
METVQFGDVEVIDDAVTDLLCRVGAYRVTIPLLLLQPGTTVRRRGDHGTLVIPRWLAIGVGLVWPLPKPARPGHDQANGPQNRRGPLQAPHRGRAAGHGCSSGGA